MEFNKRWFIFILLPLVMLSCHPVSEKLLLVNNTDKSIYYYSLLDTSDLFNRQQFEHVESHDSSHPFIGVGGDGIWEYKINNISTDSALYIWIFDSLEIDNSKLEGSARSYRKYTKLRYNVKELDSLKWRIEISKQDI